jgi:nucleoside phosphorylase
MVGLIFTTPEEAGPFVEQYAGGRFDRPTEGQPQQDDTVLLLATGLGKIKATLQMERLLCAHDLTRLLHVGTCTGLSDEAEVGTLFGASYVVEGDRVELSAASYPRMPLDAPDACDLDGTMVTQDHAVADDERQYWQRIGDVTDTTAYAVAYVAGQHGTPCTVAKAVTARAGEERDSFQEDRRAGYEQIARFLLDAIPED